LDGLGQSIQRVLRALRRSAQLEAKAGRLRTVRSRRVIFMQRKIASPKRPGKQNLP
jgi:hypothetical protein